MASSCSSWSSKLHTEIKISFSLSFPATIISQDLRRNITNDVGFVSGGHYLHQQQYNNQDCWYFKIPSRIEIG